MNGIMIATDVVTVEDMLKQFDAGGTIFTIECGGLGPGYEQALQLAAVEFTRKNHQSPMPLTGDDKKDWESWDKKCTEWLFKELDNKLGGLSGAQFGAAKWLSWQWSFRGGPKALCDRAEAEGMKDRVIQISNHFPHI